MKHEQFTKKNIVQNFVKFLPVLMEEMECMFKTKVIS